MAFRYLGLVVVKYFTTLEIFVEEVADNEIGFCYYWKEFFFEDFCVVTVTFWHIFLKFLSL